jgi:hypothetical protein
MLDIFLYFGVYLQSLATTTLSYIYSFCMYFYRQRPVPQKWGQKKTDDETFKDNYTQKNVIVYSMQL